jgi:hypothetical protein
MLIIVTGMLVALGYTFMGMSNQRQALTSQSVSNANKALAQNLAHSGLQFAIDKFNSDNSWVNSTSTVDLEDGTVQIEVNTTGNPDIINVNSTAKMNGSDAEHKVAARYDISQKENLVPLFNSSLGIATDDFNFFLGGSSNINGNDKTGQCEDRPGVEVKSSDGKSKVGENERIDGNPEDKASVSGIEYDPYADLVKRLEDQPQTERISGNYKGDLGTEDDPGIFFIEDYTKLTGGISEGYGIMVVRAGGQLDLEGELDVAGNFEFNGLVIFENAWEMDAKGTPTINGSVIVGSTEDQQVNIDINGNVQLQYDCTAHDYANMAAEKDLDADRIYKQLSIYE